MINFQKSDGLVPVIVQDAQSLQVLMLGYANREAWNKTLETRHVTFWSRSRKALWTKGETSGNYLHMVDYFIDCDNDTVLILANPIGPTCHRGTRTCFDVIGEEGTILKTPPHQSE
ncbi:MAG: phosphoribosyl-AMP cyclohydrolase [Balneolales bacterium]|nr:phosphoribosyl-AMP cyclohydrolase [Balneolales bacterium]